MPDIAMCEGKFCKKRNTCYRFTATPSLYRQSYIVVGKKEQQGDCSYYFPNQKEPVEPGNVSNIVEACLKGDYDKAVSIVHTHSMPCAVAAHACAFLYAEHDSIHDAMRFVRELEKSYK